MQSPTEGQPNLTRRSVLAAGASLALVTILPRRASATADEVAKSIAETFGSGEIRDGRITLTAPKLAETGNSVPITIAVDSPMTDADYLRRLAVFSEQNPRPKVMEAFFSPASGEASVETKMRLSGTQGVVVVAEMSDGSLWRTRQQIQVVVGACTTLPARY